jgi:hypothetical protein
MMSDSFVTVDDKGQFTLDGKPWFFHAGVYFGRRPGTCGADWMGERFEHNLAYLDRDLAKMRELGINTVGLFAPGRYLFDGTRPCEERFDQLDTVFDRIGAAGLRAAIFAHGGMSRDAWCAERGIDPGEGLWHPAVHKPAEELVIESASLILRRYADRPEVLGWDAGVGRFFREKFTTPPVRDAWVAWLRERFDDDLSQARELMDLAADETSWETVRMPTEMEPYFNQHNPRSYEFSLMQQTLCHRASERIIRALREAAPKQILYQSMEGCCFSVGHLNTIVPEMVAADALWLECYHWEGLRSYHIQSEDERRWMAEPVANKPSVEILNAAGYVQMLTRWMQRSGKGLIMCHGVDIGEEKRGVRSEEDQLLMLDRYNAFYHASGGHGVAYWCWTDDELSKTYTRSLGFEYTRDTPEEQKKYSQAGETMGILRFDESPRPVAEKIRMRSESMAGRGVAQSPHEALVLMPCPMFQSLYRYRCNLTAFGIFTSLAREGILADAAMTSAGGKLIDAETLAPYRLVILGAREYTRDHPEVADVLERYVRDGGTLLLPLGDPADLQDEYLKWRESPALQRLAGCRLVERAECNRLESIESESLTVPEAWELCMDEPAHFAGVEPCEDAEVLIRAGKRPLLYRHRLGKGSVYVFTWNLDVFLYRGAELDYHGDDWDGLWTHLASELGLSRDETNEMTSVIRQMTRS